MKQAQDFLDESMALFQLVADMDAEALARPTQFKGWTINRIIGHLHVWNEAAVLSLQDPEAFGQYVARLATLIGKGKTMADLEAERLFGMIGPDLVAAWRDHLSVIAEAFDRTDPSKRVPWVGPSMSARSAMTARLMETWAHGQAVFDLEGIEREEADRIENIVTLGVRTYDWTFKVRGQQPPGPMPQLRLTLPSGRLLEMGEGPDQISGPARDFCQVVCQTRNIADVALEVSGPTAVAWMQIAQCFAGPPEEPPSPGARFATRVA